jgi:phosphomethylpyrimidine synthase
VTQLEAARSGKLTDATRVVAEKERRSPEHIRQLIAAGRVVVCANPNHAGLDPEGIGTSLRVKVNANIGTSPRASDPATELCKIRMALAAGADAMMDLSTHGDLPALRQQLVDNCPKPVGTVPIYEATIAVMERGAPLEETSADDIFAVIENHARQGVDFLTVHCGVTRAGLRALREQGRTLGIVSRGGAFLKRWIEEREEENPLYAQYDRLLEIAREYEVTLSLGDGLRPGAIADGTDRAQIQELVTIGELVRRARQAGVQAMVEGPGHLRLDQVTANVAMEKSLCDGAPFYVLGPLVTDIATGYDHIAGAIGGAVAALAGADFLCYVTPAEHLGLPTPEDVRDGVIAGRIAAHAADLAHGNPLALDWDRRMSEARGGLDWEKQVSLAIYPDRARQMLEQHTPQAGPDGCTMCGEYCAYRIARGPATGTAGEKE